MTPKSKEAMGIYAGLVTTMQRTRQELLRLGAEKDDIDTGAIFLGQLVEKMENAAKDDFIKFTLTGRIPE